MLSGAVKRLRTTNQLKEGMERVIIDQCKFISFTWIVYNIADITNTIGILLFFFSPHNLMLNCKSCTRQFPLFLIPVCTSFKISNHVFFHFVVSVTHGVLKKARGNLEVSVEN